VSRVSWLLVLAESKDCVGHIRFWQILSPYGVSRLLLVLIPVCMPWGRLAQMRLGKWLKQ